MKTTVCTVFPLVFLIQLVQFGAGRQPRLDTEFNSTVPDPTFVEVPLDTAGWRIQYCGSQPLPPWKDRMCQNFCDDGHCRNFFCECGKDPVPEKLCRRDGREGKCTQYCESSNLIHPLLCSVEAGKYFCICV